MRRVLGIRYWALGLAAVGAATLFVSGLAQAGDSASYQDASARFTKHTPATSTGARIKIDYASPDDPSAKPPVVRRVVLKLARGARFDTLAPEWCTASDEELMAVGEQACPAESKVGSGVATVDTGFPGPGRFVTVDITFFNNDHELIYLNTVRDTDVRTVIRAAVSRRRIVTDVAMLPGTPPDGGAIDTVRIRERPLSRTVDGIRRSYITTPSECPPRGFWTNRLKFTYDGDVTQTVTSRSRCEA